MEYWKYHCLCTFIAFNLQKESKWERREETTPTYIQFIQTTMSHSYWFWFAMLLIIFFSTFFLFFLWVNLYFICELFQSFHRLHKSHKNSFLASSFLLSSRLSNSDKLIFFRIRQWEKCGNESNDIFSFKSRCMLLTLKSRRNMKKNIHLRLASTFFYIFFFYSHGFLAHYSLAILIANELSPRILN